VPKSNIDKTEMKRLVKLLKYEQVAKANGFKYIAGIDEAGRGPLAGPVVAAACIIEEGVYFEGINDSKQLTEDKRKDLFIKLKSHKKVFFGVGEISHIEIDHLNIYQATIKAMKMAVNKLPLVPDYLLVDGMNISYFNIPSEKIIEGDTKSQSIAAASIIAKETRDQLMREFHEMWPQYGFKDHKGYGTKKHMEAIEKYGTCPIHRLSFKPCKPILVDHTAEFTLSY